MREVRRRGGILRHPVFWLTLLFAGLMIAVPLHGNNVALREDLILVAVAVILASNLNLMIGYTGYVNFGHIVFYGLGGYVGLYLATVRNWNLVLAALAAGVSVSLLALLFGIGILRLRGAYFALATIGVLVAVPLVRLELRSLGPFDRDVRLVRRLCAARRADARALDHLHPDHRRDGAVDDFEPGH